MQYDGSGKLGDAIAALCGCSPRSNNKIAELIGQAKDALGMTSKSKKLPGDVKLAIYRWHHERLNPVQYVKQEDSIQNDDNQSLDDAIVQNVKRSDDDKLDSLLPDSAVYNVKQDSPVQLDDDYNDLGLYDYNQFHFGVTITHQGQPKRTTVMLEGYLVKALQRKHGLTDNAAIRAWIEQAIKADGSQFDSYAPLTKQVKRMIIESFV
jgi:hypothetical protein